MKKPIQRFSLAILLFFSSLVQAAHPNPKIVFTDLWDDDIRGIIYTLTNPQGRESVKAFVVTTGNVFLKAAILRKIIAGLGLEIPVIEGTHSQLSHNVITRFAAHFDKEGGPLISNQEREYFEPFRNRSGEPAKQLIDLLKSSGQAKFDVVLLSTPTDLLKTFLADQNLAKEKFEDLFVMGLWKEDDKGRLWSPFNSMANPQDVLRFLKTIDGAPSSASLAQSQSRATTQLAASARTFFKIVYHVPSHVIQNYSGLPMGYVPEDSEVSDLRRLIRESMQKNPVLADLYGTAVEYSMHWQNSAHKQFGAFTQDWVPHTFQNPDASGGFYFADTAALYISLRTEEELKSIVLKPKHISPSAAFNMTETAPTQPFEVHEKKAPNPEARPIFDIQSIDGIAIVRQLIEQLNGASAFKPSENYRAPVAELRDLSPKPAAEVDHENIARKALVIGFKNSPDDWMGLFKILDSEEGRMALSRGGLITEGFESEKVRNNLRRVLYALGLSNIPVATGYSYLAGDTDAFPNFSIERIMAEHDLFDEAFAHLELPTDKETALSPIQVLQRARNWALQEPSRAYDWLIFGEGIDFYRALKEQPSLGEGLERSYVMGGGRLNAAGEMVYARNWLPHQQEVLEGLAFLSQSSLAKSVVFSSDQFSGLLNSTTVHGDVLEQGKGNASTLYGYLNEMAAYDPVIKALLGHWENWAKAAAWAFKKDKSSGEKMDSHQKPVQVAISPLGIYMASRWKTGDIEDGTNPNLVTSEVHAPALSEKKLVFEPESGIVWLQYYPPGEMLNLTQLATRYADSTLIKIHNLRIKQTVKSCEEKTKP